MQAQRGSGGIAVLVLNIRATCWRVDVMRRPLFPPRSPGTPYTGGSVSPRAGPDGGGKENRSPPGVRNPQRPTRSKWLYPLRYHAPIVDDKLVKPPSGCAVSYPAIQSSLLTSQLESQTQVASIPQPHILKMRLHQSRTLCDKFGTLFKFLYRDVCN